MLLTLEDFAMKRRIISAVIYAATCAALAAFFDAVYGAGPVTRHLSLMRFAIAGTGVFAIACILSFFNFRIGVICGLGASVLAVPYFALQAVAVPWGSLLSILPRANWPYLLTAMLALVLSVIYSITSVSQAFRSVPLS
jgi:hypothetical protein